MPLDKDIPHDLQQPRTAEEWQAWESEAARRAEIDTAAMLARIQPKDPTITAGEDFLDRPGLTMRVHQPFSEGGVALPGAPCVWQDTLDAPMCGASASFEVVDKLTGKAARLCHDHALGAAKERARMATDAAAEYRAKRMAKKLAAFQLRQPKNKVLTHVPQNYAAAPEKPAT